MDHNILLHKLEFHGIRGNCKKWFESYLKGRKQYVSLNRKNLDYRQNLHGVPQGSVLGPLLFIINDLPNVFLYSDATLFADDTCLLYSNSSLNCIEKHLNVDLKRLFKWLCADKISLNVSKTEVLLFRNTHKIINQSVRLKLNGKTLPLSTSVKYLEIQLDDHLSWRFHFESLAIKLRKSNGVISRLRHYIPQSILLLFIILSLNHT